MSELARLRAKVKGLSVLIVDDEVKVLEGSVIFMRKFFDHVDFAESGKRALEKSAAFGGYDVIMSDVQMPGMDGWELMARIREKEEDTFVAAMTGSPDATPEQLLLCDAYLLKPVSIEELIVMLTKIIEKRGL